MLKLGIGVIPADSSKFVLPQLIIPNWVQGKNRLDRENISRLHAVCELWVICIARDLPKCKTGGGICKRCPIPWPMKWGQT